MSHDATGWAIKQRGLKPATKIVLWQLCDRFHPDNGCFPSQETLSSDCEMSRSSLNEHLDALEAAGLIRREQRRDGPTHRQKSTLYRFAFEAGFEAAKPAENKESPCPESGHGAVSGKQPEPCPENAESRVRNPDTNLVREPVKEPEREAREEDRKKVERDGWALLKDWPGFAGMPKEPALKVWLGLDAADRAEAVRLFPHWLALLKAQRKTHVPAPSSYFLQKLWREVPEPADEKPVAMVAPPFGPVWSAVRMRTLLTVPPAEAPPAKGFMAALLAQDDAKGRQARLTRQAAHGWPSVIRMQEQAENRRGITVAPECEALAALMEPVTVRGDVWGQWLAEHEKRGWPWLPDPGQMPVVYFPVGGPGGLEQFEQALRGDHDALKAAE